MKLLTSCKDCVFATYNGMTQIGCAADRLKHLEVEECYDEEKEFYVTKNTSCTMIRKADWLNKNESIENEVKRARKEIEFKYIVITSAENFDKKLSSINRQRIQPQKIYIYDFVKLPVPAQENMEYVHFTTNVSDPVERIIRRINKNTNIFYLDNSFDLDIDLFERLENKIYDEGYKRSILTSRNTSSFVLPTILYKMNPLFTHKRIIEEFSLNMPECVGILEDI